MIYDATLNITQKHQKSLYQHKNLLIFLMLTFVLCSFKDVEVKKTK